MLIPEKSWKRTKNNSLKSASVQSTSKKNWVTHSWTSSGCDFLNHMFVYLESCYQGNFIKDMHKASKLTNDYYYQGIYQDDPSKKKINDSRVNRWKLERMKKKGNIIFCWSFTSEKALRQEVCSKTQFQAKVKDVAFLLWRSIKTSVTFTADKYSIKSWNRNRNLY